MNTLIAHEMNYASRRECIINNNLVKSHLRKQRMHSNIATDWPYSTRVAPQHESLAAMYGGAAPSIGCIDGEKYV